MIPYRCSEREALSIAKQLFDTYDKNKSGAIENFEVLTLLNNLTSSDPQPNLTDANGFIACHDSNGDGRLTLLDLEIAVKRHFCGIENFNSKDETRQDVYSRYLQNAATKTTQPTKFAGQTSAGLNLNSGLTEGSNPYVTFLVL